MPGTDLRKVHKVPGTDLPKHADADFAKVSEATLRGAQRLYARAFIRLGDAPKLRSLMEEAILSGKFEQAEKDYLSFRLAVLESARDEASVYCSLRNARFSGSPQSSNSSSKKQLSSYLLGSTGFRIARTIEAKQQGSQR